MIRTLSTSLLVTTSLLMVNPVQAEDISELPDGKYVLDKTHASLTWKVMHMGLAKYTARFSDFEANLNLDSQDVVKSSLSATINPKSIKTDYPHADKNDFDAELANHENWFNSLKFPQIIFNSTDIKKVTDNRGVVTGDLTLLGVTKSVELTVTYNGGTSSHPFTGQPAIGFSAVGSITRSDWGLDTAIGLVADEVEIIIEAEFVKG